MYHINRIVRFLTDYIFAVISRGKDKDKRRISCVGIFKPFNIIPFYPLEWHVNKMDISVLTRHWNFVMDFGHFGWFMGIIRIGMGIK